MPDLPQDTKLAGKIVDGNIRKEQEIVERGVIGRLIGSRNNAPINIASVLAFVFSISIILFIFFGSKAGDLSARDTLASLSSIFTLLVGYIFGKSHRE